MKGWKKTERARCSRAFPKTKSVISLWHAHAHLHASLLCNNYEVQGEKND